MALSRETSKLLAGAYVDMVNLFKAGETAKARETQAWIGQQMSTMIEGLLAEAAAHRAAGRHGMAIGNFGEILGLHGLNLTGLALPISRPDSYRAIAAALHTLGLPVGAAAAEALAASDGQSRFTPPESCQIPILGGLYEALFGARADGTFVEVGAFDGDTYSNTSCLADLGWRGLYIEPVERFWRQCVERHQRNPRVATLNCAIGAEATTIKFWENGPTSTGSSEEAAVNRANEWISAGAREIEVPQMRLDTALTQTGIAPGFELLVVDVEGMEESVFASFALDAWRPACMIVELIEDAANYAGFDSVTAASRRVRALIAAAGYEEIYRDAGNTMFRRRS
jgi:FkbM family methyltransferase